MKHLHEATYCGRDSLTTYVKLWLTGPGISRAIRKVIARCVVCWKNNLKTDPHQRRERKQYQGQCPLEDWQIDCTQMPRVREWKYVLVFVDTFFRMDRSLSYWNGEILGGSESFTEGNNPSLWPPWQHPD